MVGRDINGVTADAVIDRLGLAAHPEGGHFREVYRHRPGGGERGWVTTIYYLLAAGEISHWHRIDADEVWHFYAGAPLTLSICGPENEVRPTVLGTDLQRDERPVSVVPAGYWQSAQSLGEWSLVGCTVAPAFEFDGFELAPPDWAPSGEP